MKGLALCEKFYRDCVAPILVERCPFLGQRYTAALIGWGSDVTGNDDEISRDHEWGPRLLLFVPDALQDCIEETSRMLNRWIPPRFEGFHTHWRLNREIGSLVPSETGAVNIQISTCDDYLRRTIGVTVPQTDLDWLLIPENKLFELTSGEIFYDFEDMLENRLTPFRRYYPADVWKYRVAYLWQRLGWNYDLIGLNLLRGEILSAYVALNRVVAPLIQLTSALHRSYAPCYAKWVGRELGKLSPAAREIGKRLAGLYRSEIGSVPGAVYEIAGLLLRLQNEADGLPKITPERPAYDRGFSDLDFQAIADTVFASISGRLKELPLYGAPDQYLTNEDFLLDTAILQRFRAVYE